MLYNVNTKCREGIDMTNKELICTLNSYAYAGFMRWKPRIKKMHEGFFNRKQRRANIENYINQSYEYSKYMKKIGGSLHPEISNMAFNIAKMAINQPSKFLMYTQDDEIIFKYTPCVVYFKITRTANTFVLTGPEGLNKIECKVLLKVFLSTVKTHEELEKQINNIKI